MGDIFSEIPDPTYDDTAFELKIGRRFKISCQRQSGFLRVAVFTYKSARWQSPILVDDIDNFQKLLQCATDLVIIHSSEDVPQRKLKLVREENSDECVQ